ncbi:MAG: histidinol-phosphate transaminase [Clostridiales bacterium]|nr:histidinol-phosphate transaminase [Clostridiales bacterium]
MKTWESYIRKVDPYVPGEQPKEKNVIKLNTNENPYPPAPGVVKALEAFDTDYLRRYPDPAVSRLTSALAQNYGLKQEQVFVGVGSDDVLAMSFLTFFNSEKPILFPDITYSFYDVWAKLYRIPYETPAVDESFHIRKEDYYKENGGVVIANPNAPTSIYENLDFIRDILDHNRDVIVIVDEAYIDFGGESAISLLPEYENLLVVQTFSKSRSMAGMRIGYAMGNEKLIKALSDVKYSFNSYTMNQTSISLGVEAVKDVDYFNKTRNQIISTREKSKERLKEFGFSFPDSKSNFIFATHEMIDAGELFEALKKEHIFVRHFTGERIKDYLRITIGTEEEMDAFFSFVEGYLKEKGGK